MKLAATITLGCLAAAGVAFAPSAHAHATYNIAGYDAGLAGSTNGTDGMPAATPSGTWTNGGVADYTGSLPVHWYAGMHDLVTTRVIQTGAATPPNGSLAQQVASYNTANDPDLPTDRVLAVGGKSWSDPDNANQGWGHGMDYGLVHFSPIGDLLANGPVRFTITVADDPSDGVSPRLAFALYGGWDVAGSGSSRHQTFVTSPAPVDNPLGTDNLVLLDYAVATGAGRPVSRTFELTADYAGEYTLFVAALGGVAGQYQVTIAPAADTPLAQCQAELAAASADADGDGVLDAFDHCDATADGAAVDTAGCSQAQFCGSFDAMTKTGVKLCKKADWGNDEPVMTKKTADCLVDKASLLCVPQVELVPASVE